MKVLSWSPSFRRAYQKYIQRHPNESERIEQTLLKLVEDPFMQSLDTHKLKGVLTGLWACSVAYDCRIVFQFLSPPGSDEDIILLVDIGSHDEVY